MVETFIIVSTDLKKIAEDILKDVFNVVIITVPYLPENTWIIKRLTAVDKLKE